MVTLIRYKVSKQKVSKVIDNVSKRTISMLAKELSVNVETIRFYERKGLIKQPPKPMQGYRHYPLYCKQDIFIFYIQWLIFLLIGNIMKNTMLRKGLTIF